MSFAKHFAKQWLSFYLFRCFNKRFPPVNGAYAVLRWRGRGDRQGREGRQGRRQRAVKRREGCRGDRGPYMGHRAIDGT
jgi:hypothetical protein